jgi:protein phosphatase PTC1
MISELTEELTDIPDDEDQIPLSFMGLEAFGDSLAFALLDALKATNVNVVKLALRGIALTVESCEALSNWIAENKSVLKLDLSDNGFGVEGLTKLVNGLRKNQTLQIIALESVEAGDEGTEVISSWLENSKGPLQTVNLSGNDIGEAGAGALLKALRANIRITDLRLKSNKGIPEATLQKLQVLAEGNKMVTKIVTTLIDSIPEASRRKQEEEEEAKEMEELAAIQAQRRRGAQVKVKLNVKELDAASAEWDKLYPRHHSKRFMIGWAEMQGRRPDMQDSTVIWGGFREKENEDLVCVFDGHGTEQVAVHCANNLPDALKRRLDNNEPLPEALRSTFLEVDEQVKPWAQHTGTTAAVAYIQDKTLYVANAGDTRAVLYRNGVATRLTIDHKASVPEEKERIESLGGAVINGRVRGMIQVSRAIGDAFVQPHLTPEPYLSVTNLEPTDKFLIVACDGIWDIFTDEAACEMISKDTNPQSCALKLRDQAYRLGSNDNISVIVLRFDAGDSPLFSNEAVLVPPTTPVSEPT